MVSHHAVVPDMRVGHQKIIRTDDRRLRRGRGPVRGEMFPKHIVIADAQLRRNPLVLEILGCIADDTTGMELVPLPDGRPARQINVGSDPTIRANHHVGVNHRIRPDPDRGMQFRLRVDAGSWMNHLAHR